MAFIFCDFYSRSLGKDTKIHMIFPEYGQAAAERIKFCVLIHSRGQDVSFWIRRTNIEQIAEEQNIAVIMPEAWRSFFVEMPNGKNFKKFLQEELPKFLNHTFPFLSKDPKDHMIACGDEKCSERIQDIVSKDCSCFGTGECLPCDFTDEDLRHLLSDWQKK